jgi:PAS domain S-box-containing protein
MGGHEHRGPDVGRERAGAEEALRASEERFRLMVQTVQDHAIFLMDPEGKIASWNEGAERILGYSADEVLGRSGDLFFTEVDRRAGMFERELRTAAETGRASDENWGVRKGGRRFWASGATTALRDDAGGLRGFAKIFRDLTERRQAEEKVRESEERLRVALAAGEMGTWLYRIPQDEQVLDDSLRRLMGLPADDGVMTLDRFIAAIHPDDRRRVRAEFERCIREGCDVTLEFRVTWPDGSLHWLRDQGKVFTGPDGRPQFMAGAVMDITDRMRAEEALARDAYLLASLRDSVIVTDLDGVVTYWNDGATRLFGWTAEEMIGRPCADRYPEPVRSWVAEEIRKRAAGDDWIGEFEDWRKDGSRVWGRRPGRPGGGRRRPADRHPRPGL